MKDEIKETLEYKIDFLTKSLNIGIPTKSRRYFNDIKDYITNLQQKVDQYENPDDLTLFYMWLDAKAKDKIKELQQENERLKGIAHKMHLWIFLNSGDEQKVYDELGLTDEENTLLGYSGQIRIGGGDNG